MSMSIISWLRKHTTNRTPQLSSVSNVSTSTGVHHFEICNYSLTKGRGIGTNILSRTFTVGKHNWRIMCFLDGENQKSSDCISVFLLYCPKSDKEARIKFSISLLDHATGAVQHRTNSIQHVFSSSSKCWGWPNFINKNELEASSCLRNDSLTIVCNVIVIGEPKTYDTRVAPIVEPSILYKQLGTLLSVEKGADINFEVDGRSFPAHRSVVAASSPVFRAQLSGLMKEAKEKSIKITDIKAPAFEALLLYIYTDNLPETKMLTDTGMAQHLLVAADQFALDKLRISCEKKLCEGLKVSNVCTVLSLADQHNLSTLKGACLQYLSSPKTLVSSMATDGYIHLVKSCPSIAKEISIKINSKLN
ncbi:BTB/POZ and MATH domain-containing protein 2-like [Carex rostrata]